MSDFLPPNIPEPQYSKPYIIETRDTPSPQGHKTLEFEVRDFSLFKKVSDCLTDMVQDCRGARHTVLREAMCHIPDMRFVANNIEQTLRIESPVKAFATQNTLGVERGRECAKQLIMHALVTAKIPGDNAYLTDGAAKKAGYNPLDAVLLLYDREMQQRRMREPIKR